MQNTPHPMRSVRFGVFEVDFEAGEVRKSGLKVALQEQPFLVLALLLENAGKLVSRDELQQKIWSADTFVEFDRGLNTAINKVRDALGDSAGSPRFIETLPRRGYRFLAPVEIAGKRELEGASGSQLAIVPPGRPRKMEDELQIAEAGSQAGVPAPVVARRRNRERLAWAVASIAVAAAIVLGFVSFRRPPSDAHAARFIVQAPEGAVLADEQDHRRPCHFTRRPPPGLRRLPCQIGR